MLIGAGCVAEVESSAVTLGEAGLAPRFTEAAEKKAIKVKDATCPMIHTGLQATEKGVPFMPLRGRARLGPREAPPDWKTIENPYAKGDPILLVQGHRARRGPVPRALGGRGGQRVGRAAQGTGHHRARLAGPAASATRSSGPATCSRTSCSRRAASASVYVTAVAHAPRGAWPLGVPGAYGIDDAHLQQLRAAWRRRAEGFRQYLDEFVFKTVAV